jgi:hypothetical protein
MKFSELVKLLEQNGFQMNKEMKKFRLQREGKRPVPLRTR